MKVGIELPAIGAVLVLVDAVAGKMACLLKREMLVRRLHAGDRVLNRLIAPRQTASEAAPRLDRDEAPHRVGIDPRITCRDITAKRMADEGHGRQLTLVNELREIVDIARH